MTAVRWWRAATPADRTAWAIVCLAACLPYLRTIPDYFVQDDFGVVQLLARKPWSTFPRWFTMPWMENIWGYTPDEIRPFPALSYQITALWGAAAPQGHHLLNVALHAANGLLVFALARAAAGLSTIGAAVAAVTFVLLPVDAESVAWITGRVDSMPTLFYLASFLAYVRWRRTSERRQYVWSLVWFFVALFSKQNTITMVGTLAAYDLIVERRPIRASWTWLKPYVPFAIMTGLFLALRYVVLGEVLRESQLSGERLSRFGGVIGRHLQRIVFGEVGAVSAGTIAAGIACALLAIIVVSRSDADARSRAFRCALYFGPAWLAIGLAPGVAAGYESPRHAYLAAVGWAVFVGIAFDAVYHFGSRGVLLSAPWWRYLAVGMAGGLLAAYAWTLHGAVADWSRRAAVSKLAVEVLEREVTAVAPGTLVLVGVPSSSWEWTVPFVVQPPYTAVDLTAHAFIVTPRLLNCCRDPHWEAATRKALDAWIKQPHAQVLAIAIDEEGDVRRLHSADDPDLLFLVELLRDISSAHSLDTAMVDILRTLVAGRGTKMT